VREKLAQMATRVYVGESMIYRTVGMMDSALGQIDRHSAAGAMEIRRAIEEYAVECSVIKVWCSEMLDFIVDESVQIYGGYGFVEEYPAERAYRDSRVNRIFEGTNEINRLIITGWLLKRAMSGQLPLLPAIRKLMDEVMRAPSFGDEAEGPLAAERALLANAKKICLFVAGAASQRYMDKIADHQEVMAAIADIVIECYAMDSALARVLKIAGPEGSSASRAMTGDAVAASAAMTRIYFSGALPRIEAAARKVLADVAEGDLLRTEMAILRRLAKHEPANVIALQEQVAARTLGAGKYTL
jgi:butyryl-CoA dehydrogenase